jgi:NADPH:quinone reductase-like Zn-dependent oxidoreductase
VKAAVVTGPNQVPAYRDFSDPEPQQGHELISVTAAALTHLTKGLASGAHYAAGGVFPKVVGIDGVGRIQDGRRVYFVNPDAPFGAMAETTLVRTDLCVDVPDDLDDVTAAALANPGMSSVAALKSRAGLRPGETVLVHGATGAAGTLAVQITKHLGAGRVIATGRNTQALERAAALGADVTINLLQQDLSAALTDLFSGDGVDVVLDYLYGEHAETLITAISRARGIGRPIRYVVIGGVGAQQIALPSAVLRAVPLAIMGSGVGSVSWPDLLSAVRDVFTAARPAALHIDATAVPLGQVGETWNADSGRSRVVFVI